MDIEEVSQVVKIDFENINDKTIYEIFRVDGNEAEALNDTYLDPFPRR